MFYQRSRWSIKHNIKTILIYAIVISYVVIYSITSRYFTHTVVSTAPNNMESFETVNAFKIAAAISDIQPFVAYYENGIRVLQSVCIENSGNEAGKNNIVVYDSLVNRTSVTLPVKLGPNNQAKWIVDYSTRSIPGHMKIMDHPAFFMTLTCEGNLFHFLQDSVEGEKLM